MNKLISYTKDPITPSVSPSKLSVSIKQGIITGTTVNVRKGRSTSSEVIGKLKKGDKVKIDLLLGDWYSIYFGKGGGFIHKDYIKV